MSQLLATGLEAVITKPHFIPKLFAVDIPEAVGKWEGDKHRVEPVAEFLKGIGLTLGNKD